VLPSSSPPVKTVLTVTRIYTHISFSLVSEAEKVILVQALHGGGVGVHAPDSTVQDAIHDDAVEGLRLAETEVPQTHATVALVGGDARLHVRDGGAFKPANSIELKAAVEDYCSDNAVAASIYGSFSEWNTSMVTDMSFLFGMYTSSDNDDNHNGHNHFGGYDVDYPKSNCGRTFNEDISGWSVDQVTTMDYMFWGANFFDQDLSVWNTSSVTSMSHMFGRASAFNQDIGQWDVSRVTDMG